MRYLVNLTFCHLLLFLPAMGMERIRVEDNRFVDSSGKTLIFRGVNTSDPDKLVKDGHWNEEYFKVISDWGANVVRFPVHPAAWRARTPEHYLEFLDQGVDWAEQFNLYVIVDWHSIGNLLTEQFQHAMYETSMEETLEFWRTIARRYRSRPAVAFFELFNEPTVGGEQFGEMTWSQWKEAQSQMIRVIRSAGAEAVVLVAGFNWAYDLAPVRDDPFEEGNLAYVSHPYPQKRPAPWRLKWETDWGFVADSYPVILTEIGYCLESERGAHIPVIGTDAYGEAITSYTEKKGISWVVWVFDPRWSPMLIWDWDFTPTTQGKFFKDYLRSIPR
jgi:hypothetical protein